MKVLSISDTHFGLETDGVENPRTGLNTRAEDGFRAFDQVIDYAIAYDVRLLVHSGDVFNSKTVSQSVVNAFYMRLKRLSDAGIRTVILTGNHDNSKLLTKKTGLDIATTLDIPNVTVTRGGTNDVFEVEGVQIATIGYWNTPEEVEQSIECYAQQINWNKPAILVGHMQVDYPGSPGAFRADLTNVPLSLLTKHPFSIVQLGHIHKPQILSENPTVFYVGSLVRCTSAEANDKKGFWTFDIEGTKAVNIQQIEVPCLKYVNIRGTMAEIMKSVGDKQYDLPDCIVKVTIVDSEDPIDQAYLRNAFANTFKTKFERESEAIKAPKLSAVSGMSMDTYLSAYFEEDRDKYDLLSLVTELRTEDEGKAIER